MRGTTNHRGISIARNILGGVLISMNSEPYYHWGNLAIYVTSYTLSHVKSTNDALVNPSWTYAFFAPFWVTSLMTSGYLSRYVNPRILILLAISLQSISYFVIYFLIDVSISAVYIMFGVFIGLGCGFYEGILQQHFILNLSQRHASLFSTIVISGGPIGGIIINQIVTWYANPHNLPTTVRRGSMEVFTQEEVVSRIPTLLLVLGFGFLIIQLLGLFLLREVPDSFNGEIMYSNYLNHVENYQAIVPPSSSSSPRPQAQATTTATKTIDRVGITSSNEENPSSNGPSPVDHIRNDKGTDINSNCTPWEMIRSRNFYKLSIVYMLGFSARIVVASYYKLYGQVWINDDHFLTNLGSAQAVIEIPAMVFWGYVLDRIGVTSSLVLMYAGSALSLFSMYFTARIDKWAYFVTTMCTCWMVNMYTCFSLATFQWFGRENYSVNVGIVDTVSTPGMVIPTLVLDSLIARFGHFFEFGWAASTCVLGLVIIAVSFPRNRN